jgi:hypothetical protein
LQDLQAVQVEVAADHQEQVVEAVVELQVKVIMVARELLALLMLLLAVAVLVV